MDKIIKRTDSLKEAAKKILFKFMPTITFKCLFNSGAELKLLSQIVH